MGEKVCELREAHGGYLLFVACMTRLGCTAAGAAREAVHSVKTAIATHDDIAMRYIHVLHCTAHMCAECLAVRKHGTYFVPIVRSMTCHGSWTDHFCSRLRSCASTVECSSVSIVHYETEVNSAQHDRPGVIDIAAHAIHIEALIRWSSPVP